MRYLTVELQTVRLRESSSQSTETVRLQEKREKAKRIEVTARKFMDSDDEDVAFAASEVVADCHRLRELIFVAWLLSLVPFTYRMRQSIITKIEERYRQMAENQHDLCLFTDPETADEVDEALEGGE
jgi:hypothetical protein